MEQKSELQFDEVISLGYNCQVAFSIEALFGHINSNLFNWVAVFDVLNLLKVLENPDLLLSQGITYSKEKHIWIDNLLGFGYHTKERVKFLDRAAESEDGWKLLEQDKKEVLSRFNYLREKFLKTAKSDTKKLFIHYFSELINIEDANNVVKKFSDLIKNLSGNKNSKILILFKKSYFDKAKIELPDNVIVRFVPEDNVFETINDINFQTWIEVYQDFSFNCYKKPNFKRNIEKFKIKRKLKRKFYQNIFYIGNSDTHKYVIILGFKINVKKLK